MNKRKIISWLAVVLWLALIFVLSAQPVYKSNGLSKGISEEMVKIIEKISPDRHINIDRFNHYLRKIAHFLSYMVLAILMMNVLRLMRVSGGKKIAIALVVCILFAISDEFHQLFVPGRGSQVKDVLIDTAGAIVGIFVSQGTV